MKTHYEVLKVGPNAPQELIAESARALLQLLQPRQNASEAAQQEYLSVARAYKVLSDPLLRAAYDADLHSQPASNANPAPQPEPVVRSAQSKPAYAAQDNSEPSELMPGYGIGLSSLNRVRKGEASLAKTFWYYTLLIPNIVGFSFMFFVGLTMALLGLSQTAIESSFSFYTVAAYAFFFFFNLPAVWRSSKHPAVSPFWKGASRVFVLMPAVFLVIGILAAILIPAFQDSGGKKASSTPASYAEETPASIFADLEVTESPAISSADAHYNAIYAAHPDADNIVKSSEFKAWVGSLKSEWRQEYERVLNEGTTDQVIGMLNSYEASKRYTVKSK